MVAMWECDLRGVSSFPLSIPVWIVGSTVVRPDDYLEVQPSRIGQITDCLVIC